MGNIYESNVQNRSGKCFIDTWNFGWWSSEWNPIPKPVSEKKHWRIKNPKTQRLKRFSLKSSTQSRRHVNECTWFSVNCSIGINNNRLFFCSFQDFRPPLTLLINETDSYSNIEDYVSETSVCFFHLLMKNVWVAKVGLAFYLFLGNLRY